MEYARNQCLVWNAFAQAGEYQWNVTALAADGSQLCSSDFFTFTKPAQENAPQGDGSGDSGNSGGGPTGGGSGCHIGIDC